MLMIEIEEHLLEQARALAERRQTSIDALVSELMRTAVEQEIPLKDGQPLFEISPSGIPMLPRRPGGQTVTLEMVNALRDDDYFG